MKISELFDKTPEQWGLRGDPVLWDKMKELLSESDLPDSKEKLIEVLNSSFEEITGHSLNEKDDFYIESLSTGGISSGYVSLEFWNTIAIPLLIEKSSL